MGWENVPGHARTCLRSIHSTCSTLFAKYSSGASSGYQCCSKLAKQCSANAHTVPRVNIDALMTRVTVSTSAARSSTVHDGLLHHTPDIARHLRLRSAGCHQLFLPRHRRFMFGRRAFSVAGPAVWDSLPDYLRDPSRSLTVFGFSPRHSVHSALAALRLRAIYIYYIHCEP